MRWSVWRMGARSTWEPGRKAMMPPRSTESPPLTLATMVPSHLAVVVVGGTDLFPHLDLGGLVLGEHERAFFVFPALHQGFHFVPHLGGDFALRGGEFVDGDLAFGLVADVHHDEVLGDGDDAAFDHFPFLDPPQDSLRRVRSWIPCPASQASLHPWLQPWFRPGKLPPQRPLPESPLPKKSLPRKSLPRSSSELCRGCRRRSLGLGLRPGLDFLRLGVVSQFVVFRTVHVRLTPC